MRRLTTLLLLACACAALGGCNTVAGLGKDVEAVGGGSSSTRR